MEANQELEAVIGLPSSSLKNQVLQGFTYFKALIDLFSLIIHYNIIMFNAFSFKSSYELEAALVLH